MRYGFPRNESHSIKDIAKITGYKLSGLNTIFDKGIGAYKTNPASVRPQVKSPEQWAYARIYASLDKSSKSYQVDKTHLMK
jgi:hypothetical protein